MVRKRKAKTRWRQINILEEDGVSATEMPLSEYNLVVESLDEADLSYWKYRLRKLKISFIVAEFIRREPASEYEDDTSIALKNNKYIGLFSDEFVMESGNGTTDKRVDEAS